MRFSCGLHVHHAAVVWIRTSSPLFNAAAIQVENGFITMDRPLRKRRSHNQLGVHETTSKH